MNNPFAKKHSSNKTLKLVVHRLRNKREGVQHFFTYACIREGQTQASNAYSIKVRYDTCAKAYVLTVSVSKTYSDPKGRLVEKSMWTTIRELDSYLMREYNKVFNEHSWLSYHSWHAGD